jgi:hypothetical protein
MYEIVEGQVELARLLYIDYFLDGHAHQIAHAQVEAIFIKLVFHVQPLDPTGHIVFVCVIMRFSKAKNQNPMLSENLKCRFQNSNVKPQIKH